MYKIVVEIPEGWGGILVVKKMEIPGRGGRAYVKFPPWWGYGYFLELHIINDRCNQTKIDILIYIYKIYFSRHMYCIYQNKLKADFAQQPMQVSCRFNPLTPGYFREITGRF